MRIVRICLLLLLAALLPIRGAMAAAMLCPAAAGAQGEMRLTNHDLTGHDDSAALHHHVQHDHAQHHHGAIGQHGKGMFDQDKCNQCSACCSVTPLLSAIPGVEQPHDLAAATFPDISAPAPIFLADGQERPPRSI